MDKHCIISQNEKLDKIEKFDRNEVWLNSRLEKIEKLTKLTKLKN